MQPSSIVRSARDSCIMLQNPCRLMSCARWKIQKSCPSQIGSFGRDESHDHDNDQRNSGETCKQSKDNERPQTVSTTPTNGPITSENGIPILAKCPTPRTSGNINLCRPTRELRCRTGQSSF